MVVLSLKIVITKGNVTKTIQFDSSCIVYDACKLIREKVFEAQQGQAQDYSLFLPDKDSKKGVWLESRRPLEYYLLKNGDVLEYKIKFRPLKIRTLDGSVKTVLIDDSKNVDQLMITICTKLGISNYEEHSLMKEIQEEVVPSTKKDSGTLLRPGTTDRKFETLKKKIHTEDEYNWLNHSLTLREQNVEENETLILRRKYFYSDQNVDSRDPIQLNLLYVQSRDGILKGNYPINEQDAIKFAALQCRVQLGEYDERKHKPGYLDLKNYLPKEYIKNRGIEKKIFLEHKQLIMTELEAKTQYTRNCRELKTYGVAFFLVKEKMKGKNKLVPRLLGVTRESVMRLDERTKDVLKVWPLTSVKRWAASPKSFTLDFGDYQDGYYSVQTTEGEKIAQLISGYIDIILKKKTAKDYKEDENAEDVTMVEDMVLPGKAHNVTVGGSSLRSMQTSSLAMAGVLRNASDSPSGYTVGSMSQSQFKVQRNFMQGSMRMNPLQQALLGSIEHGLKTCQATIAGFSGHPSAFTIGTVGTEEKESLNNCHHCIEANLHSIVKSTASVILSTCEGKFDHSSVGCAVSTIIACLSEMTKTLQLLAGDTDDDSLLKAATDLTMSISDFLKCIKAGDGEPRKKILDAAGKIGEASKKLLMCIGIPEKSQFQDTLMNSAKQVAASISALVMQTKNVASNSTDLNVQQRVASAATKCAFSASDLITCVKILNSSLANLASQETLVNATSHVSQSVDECVESTQGSTADKNLLQKVNNAADGVKCALENLIQQIKEGPKSIYGKYNEQCESIISACANLSNSLEDAFKMIKQTQLLAQVSSELVSLLTKEAEESEDSTQRDKLIAAAKLLSDATGKLVEAAKASANDPSNMQNQEKLKEALKNILATGNVATHNNLRKHLVGQFINLSHLAAITATQAVVAVNAIDITPDNKASLHQLSSHTKVLQDDYLPLFVEAIAALRQFPDSVESQQNLIVTANEFVTPALKMVALSKAILPVINNQINSAHLKSVTENLSSTVHSLKNIITQAEELCGNGGIEAAMETIEMLKRELSSCSDAIQKNQLQPQTEQDLKKCTQEFSANVKVVGASMAQLVTAVLQKNEEYSGMTALSTANALRSLVGNSRGVASHLVNEDSKLYLISSTSNVLNKLLKLLGEAKAILDESNESDARSKLSQAIKAVSGALTDCIGYLPGQKEIDEALKHIDQSSKQLLSKQISIPTASYQSSQLNLQHAAEQLSMAANGLVSACRGGYDELDSSTTKYKFKFSSFVDSGMEMAGQWKNKEDQATLIDNLKSVSIASSKLLLSAKTMALDSNAPNAKNQLAAAARAVTESINDLMTRCMTSAPGQRECDNVSRQLETVMELLENPTSSLNDFSYFDCIDNVSKNSKLLSESVIGLLQHAKNGNFQLFGDAITDIGNSIVSVTETTAQAAYLVGVADINSEPGEPGLIDFSQFSRANQAIQSACKDIIEQDKSKAKILTAATVVAKHASALCNVCHIAAQKVNNQNAKQHLIQSTKEIANITSKMVKDLKTTDFSTDHKEGFVESAVALAETVDGLTVFLSRSEFSGIPAKISDQAREAQLPIVLSGQHLLSSSKEMIKSARLLTTLSNDQSAHQTLGSQCRIFSDAVKRLNSSIRENSPSRMECDNALEAINLVLGELNDASLFAMDQSLPSYTDNTFEGFQNTVVDTVNQIRSCLEPIVKSAKSDAFRLGREVTQVASLLKSFSYASIGSASLCPSHQRQMEILDYSKTLAESVLHLLYIAKESGGNPKSVEIHNEVDTASGECKDAIDDLLKSMREAPEAIINDLIGAVENAFQKISDGEVQEGETFADYQTRMISRCKALIMVNGNIGMKLNDHSEELLDLSKKLTEEFVELSVDGAGAIALADSPQVKDCIQKSLENLGDACKNMIKSCGEVQNQPSNFSTRKVLMEAAKIIKEKVSEVLASLQMGGRGIHACINAHTKLQGIIADLDTTLMFASSGALSAEDVNDDFSQHKEAMIKGARNLVEVSKLIVTSAVSSQEKLAESVEGSVKNIEGLVDAVKLGVTISVDANNTQMSLINAVRDVASSLSDLVNSAKEVSAKSPDASNMSQLQSSAKVMVSNVTSLLKTVKSVDDETSKGSRSLEDSIQSIKQEVNSLRSFKEFHDPITPEQLIHITKPITRATARIVAAGNSCRQEDMVTCAEMGKKAVIDMLHVFKAAAANADDVSQKEEILQLASSAAESCLALLINVKAINHEANKDLYKSKLIPLSKNVATAVSNLVRVGEKMKGSDWVDPNDPNVIAEQELLAAAASIEAAAKKLSQLRPRKKPKEIDDTLNFEEQILEAAKSIATATTALVKAASAAQKELVLQGKVGSVASLRHDDGQWSQGLISAAQLVASSTGNLCEAANQAVQGEASEEKLVTSAKQVASSTAQLLVACKVKADPNSENMKRLQTAGNAVKKASESLVKSAKEAAFQDEENDEVGPTTSGGLVGSIREEMEAMQKILAKEKELKEAQERLWKLREQKYQKS